MRYSFSSTVIMRGPPSIRGRSLAWSAPSYVPYRRPRYGDIHVYNYL